MTIIKFILVIFFFLLAIYQFDIKVVEIFNYFLDYFSNNFNYYLLFTVLFLILFSYLIISLRSFYIIKIFTKKYFFFTSIKYNLFGSIFSNFLFSFAGEFYKINSSAGSRLPRTDYSIIIIYEKILSLIISLFIPSLILIFFFKQNQFSIILFIFFIFYFFKKNLINLILNLPIINLYMFRVKKFLKLLLHEKKKIIFIVLLTILIQLNSSIIYYLVFNEFIEINFFKFLVIVPILSIVLSLIAVPFGGAGVREFFMPFLFSFFFISQEISIKASLLVTFFQNIFLLVIILLFFFLKLVAGLGFEPRTFRL